MSEKKQKDTYKKRMNLTWLRSYETIEFDTSDGDIDVGQYAVSESGRFIIRRDQKNNANTKNEKQKDPLKDLQEITFNPRNKAYYHEFILPNGRIYREKTTKEEYYKISQNILPTKDMTDEEVKKIKEDDKIWPHSITRVQIQDISQT